MCEKLIELLERSLAYDGTGREMRFTGGDVVPVLQCRGRMKGFTVIDNKTGNYPDCEDIALNEDWAKHLCYCDIDTFAITEDGGLILMDDCGKCANCPDGRFTVVWED